MVMINGDLHRNRLTEQSLIQERMLKARLVEQITRLLEQHKAKKLEADEAISLGDEEGGSIEVLEARSDSHETFVCDLEDLLLLAERI
jgi:hypothetical protein